MHIISPLAVLVYVTQKYRLLSVKSAVAERLFYIMCLCGFRLHKITLCNLALGGFASLSADRSVVWDLQLVGFLLYR
jgi:hypothetical protein